MAIRRATGPNDQNSDRGIETLDPLSPPSPPVHVRTTRIPTEELKLRQSYIIQTQEVNVRTTRIPTEELKRQWITSKRSQILGPNDQNSDRGIETLRRGAGAGSVVRVRTTRIPTEELKLVLSPHRGARVHVRTTRIPTEELKPAQVPR